MYFSLLLSSLFKGKSCQVSHLAISWSNFQFSNALRIIEMVPVLKKLKVWTLYVHIVLPVNPRGLGVNVETNCLRHSDLIPRLSFLSTTFSIFINGVLMCVFACSLVADKASLSSELSKCKQSKSILKVITLVMPWLRV